MKHVTWRPRDAGTRALAILAAGALALPLVAATTSSAQETAPEVQAQQDEDYSILVVGRTLGFRHGSIVPGTTAIIQLGAENGFEVDVWDPAQPTRTLPSTPFTTVENLAQYDAIVFLSPVDGTNNPANAPLLNDSEFAAFQGYIRNGGGFAGIHAATDTMHNRPWYGQLVGAYFRNHPANQDAKLVVADDAHPSTAHLATVWNRHDEWYNFTANPRGNVHVLLTIDERSYNPGSGAMGTDHPMAWCHTFEGGRSWYTALGHTNQSYTEPAFLQHILGGIEWAAGAAGGDCGGTDWEHFEKVAIDTNTRFPSELDVAGDGRVFFIEMGERRQATTPANLKVIDPGTQTTTVVDTLDVYTGIATGNAQEDGLLGLALDPSFDTNNWLYLFRSVPGPVACPTSDITGGSCGVNRLSRFTLTGEGLTEEKVMLDVTVQREQCCHEAGSLEFDKDGNLYISTGDDTNPFESQGYAPIDERPGRQPFDAQRSSANTNDLRGKILKITPTANGGYTIPEGNLFPPRTLGARPEIYAMGFRNPYRIEADPETGQLYAIDYGPDAGGPNADRGPEGRVEWNVITPGNYGWPYCHGGAAYRDWAFPSGPAAGTFDCANPVNESPNNTGMTDLPPVVDPEIFYGRLPFASGGANQPDIGTGGAPTVGPVYRYEADDVPVLSGSRRWPESYDGQAFFGEWGRTNNNMYNFILDDQQQVHEISPLFHGVFNPWTRPHEIEFGPDGALYVIQWGHTFGTTGISTIQRIDYTGGPTCSARDVGASTVVIGGVDSGVPNRVAGASCSVNQLIDDDPASWASSGDFVRHVGEVADYYVERGVITARQKGSIVRAATQSGVG
ncbi:ThuA domain-containing protein [Jiangella ureilytica]|uniref:ThuA domain-containing protein n=1 Tax=Jiangella ureilytica TaxID=2530374 RepID=A0A4R4RGF7_9ACTN|nr:ThuA domain-containing protein [Jiangella ureilytica]TDC48364.1 ThuA domain-containing protein [Jiangella ureilytica]